MRRPATSVLIAFVLVVLIGGTNFVAVRFSNRDLPPFWGAGLRFAIAGALLLLYAWWRRIPLPVGRLLGAVAALGVLNFGVTYAFAYWGLVAAPAAMAATFVASAPLLTFGLAVAVRMERFRWSGVVGGAIALIGVAVIFADQLAANVPVASVVALFLNALSLAGATVILKRLPRTDPIGTNAVAMLPGAAFLFILAAVVGERPGLPAHTDVWIAFAYLATVGSIGLFYGVVFIVKRWTASASAYVTVLFPIVTGIVAAILARELVSAQFVLGLLLVMLGTYVGAIL